MKFVERLKKRLFFPPWNYCAVLKDFLFKEWLLQVTKTELVADFDMEKVHWGGNTLWQANQLCCDVMHNIPPAGQEVFAC